MKRKKKQEDRYQLFSKCLTMCLGSHLVLDFLFFESFKITVSIGVLVIYLFIFSISSWFCLGSLQLCRTLSISSRLFILWTYNCLQQSLMILYISVVSVVIYLFSFLIFIDLSSLHFFLNNLAKGLSIFFAKNQLLFSLIFSIIFSIIYFCSYLYDFFPSTNFGFCWFLFISLLQV